jgi:hypothetical protein
MLTYISKIVNYDIILFAADFSGVHALTAFIEIC